MRTLEAASAAVSGGSNLVTVGRNGTRYPRKFDHDECRARFAAGETISELAAAFAVSPAAVYLTVDPGKRAASNQASNLRLHSLRRPCLGDCGRLVWMHGKHDGKAPSGYCRACAGALRYVERHGAPKQYQAGCRCDLCRAAATADRRARRARRSPEVIAADNKRDRERRAAQRRAA